METVLAAAANSVLVWHPLPGQVRPRSVIVLGVFTVAGSPWPDPALRGVVVGLVNNLPCHLHIARGQSSVDRQYGTRDPGGLV